MTHFIQLHTLTILPPSCVNRDELGRPKTTRFGGSTRLRLSSQSLKRAWRVSDVFAGAVGELSSRTRYIGNEVLECLGGDEGNKKASKRAAQIAGVFGKVDGKAAPRLAQMAHIYPSERKATLDLARTLAAEDRDPTKEELQGLLDPSRKNTTADTAAFGRFLADARHADVEASVQVAHSISTHPVAIETDDWVAVDDQASRWQTDAGTGGMGQAGFASATMYGYVVIDADALVANLDNDVEKAQQVVGGLIRAACTVLPRGKVNSHAHGTLASYARVEVGEDAPRSLAAAFRSGVRGEDLLAASVAALEGYSEDLAQCYGVSPMATVLNVTIPSGSIDALVSAAGDAVRSVEVAS